MRLFPAPSRVIAPYPAMTDLCLQGALGLERCRGYEAAWYDPAANGLGGGLFGYVAGVNQPYNRVLDYRRLPLLDGLSYLFPWCTFRSESGRCLRRFQESAQADYFAYLVGSAGMSTRQGAEGQRRCLRRLEALLYRTLREMHGECVFTLLADHGHTYTPSRPAPLDRQLREKGWRPRDEIRSDRDVVSPRLGLVTYAGFWTRRPADLAADPEGYFSADDLFRATVDHVWPDPLRRLWRAHFALVEHPPDVVVSLQDSFFLGSGLLSAMVNIASTHGGLNYANSAAFVASTAGPLPADLRNDDLPAAMTGLLGRPWPRPAGPAK